MSAGPDDVLKRKPDEEENQEFGLLDAVAADLLEGFEKKDKKLIKMALEGLVEHIMDVDQVQDQDMFEQQ